MTVLASEFNGPIQAILDRTAYLYGRHAASTTFLEGSDYVEWPKPANLRSVDIILVGTGEYGENNGTAKGGRPGDIAVVRDIPAAMIPGSLYVKIQTVAAAAPANSVANWSGTPGSSTIRWGVVARSGWQNLTTVSRQTIFAGPDIAQTASVAGTNGYAEEPGGAAGAATFGASGGYGYGAGGGARGQAAAGSGGGGSCFGYVKLSGDGEDGSGTGANGAGAPGIAIITAHFNV